MRDAILAEVISKNSSGFNRIPWQFFGGTGAGIFLDIAYMLQGVVSNIGAINLNVIGYLFTPDVNLSVPQVSTAAQRYIRRNGYASLKELDYWMNAEARGEAFIQQYANDFKVNTKTAPYQLCYLISGSDVTGIALPNAYRHCMRVAAESALNFITNADAFPVQSFLVNVEHAKVALQKDYCANYVYAAPGISQRIMSNDDILNYLAHLLLLKLDRLSDNEPTSEDVNKLFDNLVLDEASVIAVLEEGAKGQPDQMNIDRPVYHYRDVFGTSSLYDPQKEISGWINASALKMKENVKKAVERRMKSVQTQVEGVFADSNRGPWHACWLLNHSTKAGSIDLLQKIKAQQIQMETNILTAESNFEATQKRLNIIRSEAQRHHYKFLLPHDNYKDYIILVRKYWKLVNYRDQNIAAQEFYSQLYDLVLEYSNQTVEQLVGMLKALGKVFLDNANILTNIEAAPNGLGTIYTWKINSFESVKTCIDDAMKQPDFAMSDEYINNFLIEILAEKSAFCGTEKEQRRLGEVLSKYIGTRYERLLGQSLDEEIAKSLGVNYDPQDLDQTAYKAAVTQILAPRMEQEASPQFYR